MKIKSISHEKKNYEYNPLILSSRFSCNTANTGRWQTGLHNISNGDCKEVYTSRFVGGTIIIMDFSAVEVKVIGAVSGDPTLLQAFRDGVDIHTKTASLVFQKPMEEIQKVERSLAKNATFHILYGGSVNSFAQKYCKGDKNEAEKIINSYFTAYPKIKEYIENSHKQVDAFGRISTYGNRVITIEEGRFEDQTKRYRESQNFGIQSTAEDAAGTTLYNICMFIELYPKYVRDNNLEKMRELIDDSEIERKVVNFLKDNPRKKFKSKVFCFIHDSIETDVHPEEMLIFQEVVKYFFNIKTAEEWDMPVSSDLTLGPSMGQEIEVLDTEYSDDYLEGEFTLDGYIRDIDQIVTEWKKVYNVEEIELEDNKDEEGNYKDKEEFVSWSLMFLPIKAPVKSSFGTYLKKGKRRYHIKIK